MSEELKVTSNAHNASVSEFKTLTETEVLRRQHSLMLKLWAGCIIFALSVILVMVVAMSYYYHKATNSAVNAVARSIKYSVESESGR